MHLRDLTMKNLRKIDRDDVLQAVGLQRHRGFSDWILPVAGVFAAGLALGAGLGLLLAPKSGKELRTDLRHRMHNGVDGVTDGVTEGLPMPRLEQPPRTM